MMNREHIKQRYFLLRRIGQGSTGVVYEAYDHLLNERVAVKTIRTVEPSSLYRLKREFRSLVDLDHPNLVELYDLVVDDQSAFFTMELVDGMDFLSYCGPQRSQPSPCATVEAVHPRGVDDTAPTERLPRGHRAAAERRLRWALRQLVEGVDTLHQAGKLHRDIKPSNVLITRAGDVKILDFGLVLDLRGSVQDSSTDVIVGTVAYMSPEQADGAAALGSASDWYSVGVLLFAALTGRLPFSGNAVQVVLAKQNERSPSPRHLSPNVPSDLDELCRRLLERRPEDRPSIRDILGYLGSAMRRYRPTGHGGHAFAGRTEELEALREVFAVARRGQTSIALVSGPSGIGKSSLVREFLFERSTETILLRGRCFERESVPYQAMDRAIDELSYVWNRLPREEAAALIPPDMPALVQLFPVLRAVSAVAHRSGGLGLGDPQERRTRAFSALREVLSRLGARHAIVLSIDDMQWVDADTVALLNELLRPPDPPPLMLLLAARPMDDAGPHFTGLLRALGSKVRAITLAPLGLTDAVAMATRMLGARHARLAAQIAAQADGNPFFVAELTRYAVSSARPDGGGATAVSVDNVVHQRVVELSPDARRLLEALAVAGAPVSRQIAMSAAKMPATTFARTLRQLERRSLIRKLRQDNREAVELYHDRLRQAILSGLSPRSAVAHNRALATALDSFDEGTAAQRARHWLAARAPERATGYVLRAAKEAAMALAFDRAAAFYSSALKLKTFSKPVRVDIELQLAVTLARAARGPEAAEVYLQVAKEADPDLRLICEKHAAEQWLVSGHIERGLEVVRQMSGRFGGMLARTSSSALLSILWHRLQLVLFGYRWRERAESEMNRYDKVRLDVYRVVSQVVGMVDPLKGTDLQTRQLRLSLKSGEPFRVARSLLSEATYRSTEGPRNRSLSRWLLGEARKIAERLESEYLLAVTLGSEGFVHYSFGEFELAHEISKRADEKFSQQTVDGVWERNTVRFVRLWSLLRMARYDELTRLFDKFVLEATRSGDRYTETTLRRSVNRIWLVRNDLSGAREDLERTTWEVPTGRFHLQHWFELRATGELALYAGQPELKRSDAPEFAAVARSMLTRVQFIRTESRWLRARIMLLEAGRGTEARRIGRALQREDAPYAKVWGLLTEAAAVHQLGNDERAADLLREAIGASGGARMRLCEQAARFHLGRVLGGSIGNDTIEDARRNLFDLGLAEPQAMLRVVAPGFD